MLRRSIMLFVFARHLSIVIGTLTQCFFKFADSPFIPVKLREGWSGLFELLYGALSGIKSEPRQPGPSAVLSRKGHAQRKNVMLRFKAVHFCFIPQHCSNFIAGL